MYDHNPKDLNLTCRSSYRDTPKALSSWLSMAGIKVLAMCPKFDTTIRMRVFCHNRVLCEAFVNGRPTRNRRTVSVTSINSREEGLAGA